MTSYTKWRRLLLGAIIVLGIGALASWVYKDFLIPISPQSGSPQRVSTEEAKQSPPPNDNEVHAYTVPLAHPRRLIVPSSSINALIKPLGVLKDGALDAPKTAWDVGWYEKSGLPGQAGAMLIDGHVNDSYNTPGVFAHLKDIKTGDTLMIERGDGTMFSYSTVRTEQLPADQVDMKQLLRPLEGSEGLNLITCGGTYDKKTGTYNDRILVFAKRA